MAVQRAEPLSAIVNIGHVRVKIHGLHPPATSVKWSVNPGAVALVPRSTALGMVKAPPMRGTGGGEDEDDPKHSTDYPHRWSYLRWWELGLEVADAAGLADIAKPQARTVAALARPVDPEKFAQYFRRKRPGASWDHSWEPMGRQTLTLRQAQLYATVWDDPRWIRAYARLMSNENGVRNEGLPFVAEAESLRDFCEKRVQAIREKLERSSGVTQQRDPFGPGARGQRLAAPLPR